MNQQSNNDETLRYSSESDGFQIINRDGVVVGRPAPIPFRVMNRLGRWQPICVKHKLIFKKDSDWYEHYTTICDHIQNVEYPPSDHKRHLKGYSKA